MPALKNASHARYVCYCAGSSAEAENPSQSLEYRLALCYALRHFLLELEFATHLHEIRAMLSDMKTRLDNGEAFKKKGFFSLYPLPGNEGCIAVDDASGCAPLVLKRSKKRFTVFQEGLTDLIENLEAVVKVLARPKHIAMWTDALHTELENVFHPPAAELQEVANG